MQENNASPSATPSPAGSPASPPDGSPAASVHGHAASTGAWERSTLERLAFASLQEQRSARRWRNGLRMAWLLFFAVMAWVLLSRSSPTTGPSTPHTAMVEVRGEISAGSDASAETVNTALQAAFADDSAKAVVVVINSPGGSPVQAGLINDEIRRLKAKVQTHASLCCAAAAVCLTLLRLAGLCAAAASLFPARRAGRPRRGHHPARPAAGPC